MGAATQVPGTDVESQSSHRSNGFGGIIEQFRLTHPSCEALDCKLRAFEIFANSEYRVNKVIFMVKCTNCGYLASMNSGSTTYPEVLSLQRKQLNEHEASIQIHDKKNAFICLAMAADLCEEYGPTCNTEKYSTILSVVVVSRERLCDKFVPYQPGYSPREVSERVRDAELLRIAQERLVADESRAEERRKADSDFRKEQRAEDIKRQDSRDKRDFRNRALLSLVTGVVGFVFGQVVSYTGCPTSQSTSTRTQSTLELSK